MNVITVEKRDLGKRAKQLRRAGIIPGCIFGGHLTESIPIQMDMAIANKLVRDLREGSRLTIKVDGENIPVQIKKREINQLKGEITHIDFQALEKGVKVNSLIHIMPVNTEKIAKLIEHETMVIPYTSLPEDMIDIIEIDMAEIKPGKVITVGDIPELNKPEIELQIPKDSIVLKVNIIDESLVTEE